VTLLWSTPAQKVQWILDIKDIQVLAACYPPPTLFSLALANYFLFLMLKRELAGLTFSLDEFKMR
jgi:hypothetical protein